MSQSGSDSFTANTLGVTNKLSIPSGKNLPDSQTRTLPPSVGSIAFNNTDQQLYVGTVDSWIPSSQSGPFLEYDYIIIGGGTAGCILARKLSDDFNISVLVIETGGNYVDDPITLDPNWPSIAGLLTTDPRFAINYPLFYAPLTIRAYPEGQELGGSAAHNFLLAIRGTPSVYDQWVTMTGNSNWSYNGNILNLMKALENYTPNGTILNPAQRGVGGPISVTQGAPLVANPNGYLDTLSTVTFAPFVADYNDPTTGDTCISAVEQFVTPGIGNRRSFSAYDFLYSVIDANGKGIGGRNLTVLTNAQALNINFDVNKRATSVNYTFINKQGGSVQYQVVQAKLKSSTGTLILSAGSVQTPKLLLQSGVGPSAQLSGVGVPLVLDSQNVGQNLQCQYGGSAIISGDNVPFGAEAFISGAPYMANDGVRRIQLIHIPIGPGLIESLPVITNPKSRGSVTITTDNRYLQPKVDIGLFSDGNASTPGTDAFSQVSFYKIIKDTANAAIPALTVLYPTPDQYLGGNATLIQAALDQMTIQSHIVGTCRMGTNISNGVVDGNLKVFGLQNVYIGDNSIQPETSNGNVCYPAYIIALVLCQVLGVSTPPIL